MRDEEAARDVLQDSFVKIWKNIPSYDSQKGRLFTWLLNIARNTAIDALRTRHAGQSIQTGAEIVDIIDQQQQAYQPNPEVMDLPEKVSRLNPDRQTVIDLVYFRGYTHEEAAEKLNLPLGTVKTRVRSALQELKKLFGS
ncbi:RNA polymerase sigma factor [Larkinella soli]|uniref:RNA polymerase sigma factor n=1 Tax=Larkinella soli TaxID=1770527 RepID=UPI0035B5D300